MQEDLEQRTVSVSIQAAKLSGRVLRAAIAAVLQKMEQERTMPKVGEQTIIDETTDEWMQYIMNVNLGGPMRYIREALKYFLPKNDGVIINISSVNGARPFCGATYTSTKGALNTLTKNVAMRLIETNIRCNAVAPGATVTPAHLANKAGVQPGGAKMLEHSGHFVYFPGPECEPVDQAYACLYLASKMGRHVKGQVLQVCNGAFL